MLRQFTSLYFFDNLVFQIECIFKKLSESVKFVSLFHILFSDYFSSFSDKFRLLIKINHIFYLKSVNYRPQRTIVWKFCLIHQKLTNKRYCLKPNTIPNDTKQKFIEQFVRNFNHPTQNRYRTIRTLKTFVNVSRCKLITVGLF